MKKRNTKQKIKEQKIKEQILDALEDKERKLEYPFILE